ncbi:MAG: DUF2294 domain-containing protein [Spirulinaceae cyanobacterium RM2_2_10]|nr:DUF2294 domain-containing protein [Spirulinaceae cyanobacterium SM2_1_0]NJO21095.1 DUF2294 domain-containing protein [Spirulinaceae cyanobacterium RM2_2_10]
MIEPTRGQLERSLSQRLQALYREELGQQPSRITCQLFDNKLAAILEDSVTPAEQLIAQQGKAELTDQMRIELTEATKPHVKALIEEVLQVNVRDILSDTTLETGRRGIIAILETPPAVRSPNSNSRAQRE